MSDTIKKVTIQGFKSIRDLKDFKLQSLNVLIGSNGAGKSNFINFFRLLHELVEGRLQVALRTTEGGADACLHLGPKFTKQFAATICLGKNAYQFKLEPTTDSQLVFAEELIFYSGVSGNVRDNLVGFGSGHLESRLTSFKVDLIPSWPHNEIEHIHRAISNWVLYHFHDTSLTAGVRREQSINDNSALRHDAENLAPFLYRIQQTHRTSYLQIRDVIRLAAPYFGDFNLRQVPMSPDRIRLEWLQKDSDYPFQAHQLSDGTLRFICLATALLQPERPTSMFFDEPELGLHPYALTLLGNLFRQASLDRRKQVVLSTQSAALLNEFEPEEVITVDRERGQSTFRRLDPVNLSEWLQEYTLGDLWQKNVIGARPHSEVMSPLASTDENSRS